MTALQCPKSKSANHGNLTVLLLPFFPGGSDGKSVCLQCRRPGFNPWFGKIPWRRERLPTPVFRPGEFHCIVHGVAKSRTRLSNFHSFIQQTFSYPKTNSFESLFDSKITFVLVLHTVSSSVPLHKAVFLFFSSFF